MLEIYATSDALELTRYFDGLVVRAPWAAREATEAAGYLLKYEIRDRASGPPGPNVGESEEHYRDSWGVTMIRDGLSSTAVVGTDKPYGRRLEWGFVGIDSLGRSVHQRPRPHVGPALAVVEPIWVEAIFNLTLDDGLSRSGARRNYARAVA